MTGYDALRRHPRGYRRVQRQGAERFEDDGGDDAAESSIPKPQRDHDDDMRILTQLPPHWAVFNERG